MSSAIPAGHIQFEFYPQEYKWVLLSVLTMATECLLVGFFLVGSYRSKVFGKEFIEKNFEQEAKDMPPNSLSKAGYPDMGNGRFSEKLSYKDWFNFNLRVRAHSNFFENIGSMIFATLVAGILYPFYASILGFVYCAARLGYVLGYTIKPKFRFPGFAISMLCFLAQTVLAITGCVWLIL